MRLLLDSHVVLSLAGLSTQLGVRFQDTFRTATVVYYSPVTPWELGIKRAKGRLSLPDDVMPGLPTIGLTELPITAAHGERAAALPLHHHDPFDRMLVAQAQAELLTLATTDYRLHSYDVEIIDPRR